MKLFRLFIGLLLALLSYIFMMWDQLGVGGVYDYGPLMVIFDTGFWWLILLYAIAILVRYAGVAFYGTLTFNKKVIFFYTIVQIIATIVATSICRSNEIQNVIENGVIGITLSFISMIVLRGISVDRLIDDTITHVGNILQESNKKRFEAEMEDLEKLSTEEKAAVDFCNQKYLKAAKNLESAQEELRKKGFYK